jgi:uncharacterized protein (UPF0248 family)
VDEGLSGSDVIEINDFFSVHSAVAAIHRHYQLSKYCAMTSHRLSTTISIMFCSIHSSLAFSRMHNTLRPTAFRFMARHVSNEMDNELTMDNIYREWTVQDDETLYTNRHLSTVKLASLLGRGLHGVESRMKKLSDVNSAAYSRLFGATAPQDDDPEKKLTPVKEVLRRIQWDTTLDANLFAIVHYDRMDDMLCETPFNATNDSISGKERQFAFALPEHRIQSVKYRERVVWDKEMRMDCVFGSMNGKGETIDRVVETYVEWERKKEETEARNRRRYLEMVNEITALLGEERVSEMKRMTAILLEREVDLVSVRDYIKAVMRLYYEASSDFDAAEDQEDSADDQSVDEESKKSDQTPIIHFLYVFSELVVVLPNENWREAILAEVETIVKSKEGVSKPVNSESTGRLPELKEEDLEEKFVRGSG